MIAEILNRQVVLDELRRTISELSRQSSDTEILAELKDAEARETAQSSGQPGYEAPPSERRGPGGVVAPLDDFAFLSRDPTISLFQSAMTEYVEQKGGVEQAPPADDSRRGATDVVAAADRKLRIAPAPRRTPDGRRVFDAFSITDPRWIQSKIAEGIRLFRGKHPFNPTPTAVELPADRVRLIVVGDWGSGLPRARKVAAQMRKVIEKGGEMTQHVIHLGDVYYSGWGREYRDYALKHWPVSLDQARSVGSWSLNGNHDMYSGGHGYFETMLADTRFALQKQSSYFSLFNKHWKILGLDTSWEDAALCDPQPDWLENELRDNTRRTLLLSHHQVFSAYEGVSKNLVDKVAPILERHPIDAWFWGHEHRCVLYRGYANVTYGRCTGHGGVPVYQWHKENDDYPVPAEYEYRAYYKKGLERWAVFGFAVIDLDGESASVKYIDEDGREHHSEPLSKERHL
jgi:hypothetical protein